MTNKVKIITLLGFQYSRWKQQSHGLILLDAIESPSSIYFPWASNSMWSVYGLISSPSTSILICDDQNTLKACRISFARERKCGWFVAWTLSNPLGKSGFVIIMQYCVRVHIVTYLSLSFDLIWFTSSQYTCRRLMTPIYVHFKLNWGLVQACKLVEMPSTLVAT